MSPSDAVLESMRARIRELTADLESARAAILDAERRGAAARIDLEAENYRLHQHLKHITVSSRGHGADLARAALYGAPAPGKVSR